MRINKYLRDHNFASRREADELISRGLVKINGRIARLGEEVSEKDKIVVNDGKKFKDNKYFAYYKPRDIITHSPQGGEKSIGEVGGFSKEFFPVGRLDKDSHGLIVITNDGRVTRKLLDPAENHEKEYMVKVDKDLTEGFLKKMTLGVKLEDFTTKKCAVKKIGPKVFKIILTEGKKHQIRRMCAALGYTTLDLKRVRIGSIKINDLNPGQKRELAGSELANFLKALW
ncbi:hypothetical protein A2645_00945 [Candidatus Nomurabacteria bacterium RIFCSPHIGHO2_01_FULL_39_9]|uniref:Pseudouridine synthase n=1 Tax=Candidatus Nomurabacteria bacterium RIFCSPHIGHO2_01_FULL_39_9 TaxID=1801735 RepID=A0A1F6UWZ8_9BACT|nr:MAG: hypothetical protein A2645_00945 [Candidatus Nomurabacteria bacterium RIFCSPHIGHO2_01_FULL_39_9]